MNKPCVYIVGAGPGDPSLISVRGRRFLERADVIVHDHRIPAGLLRIARADAEKIDVGPPAPRLSDQEAISILLAEKVREGKTVVRLKWGDPFVFDSGGKEALLLNEQGIAFEIVPGIPAAIGGTAYAGIPITYPGAGDVIVLVRGHEGETDAPPEVDWSRLAGVAGTIVCYAGSQQIGTIANELIANGRSPDESSALIYNSTVPSQRTTIGTLGSIAGRALEGLPSLFVIGRAVGLRDHLRWFDDRPLFGRRIVVTRSREQADELIDMLEERGAEAIAAPTTRVTPPQDLSPLENAVDNIAAFNWIVFTSVNAVSMFMSKLLAAGDVRDLKGIRLCALGASTGSRLQQYGIRVDLMPAEYRVDALMSALAAPAPLDKQRILLLHADNARELLVDELRHAGADVTEVAAFRTSLAQAERDSDQDIYGMLLDRQIDAVTFSSASTVRNFVEIYGREQAADLLRTTVVASIGPVTAEAAQQLGIRTTVMPSRYTIPDLVDALVEHFTSVVTQP